MDSCLSYENSCMIIVSRSYAYAIISEKMADENKVYCRDTIEYCGLYVIE